MKITEVRAGSPPRLLYNRVWSARPRSPWNDGPAMHQDLRRGPPLDLRDRLLIAAIVAWCLGLGGLLFVSAFGLPPGSSGNVACAFLAAASILAALILVLVARRTPRPSDRPGALLEDGEALALVTDHGIEPLGPGIAVYLAGMAVFAAGSVRFVNGAHVADAVLGCAILHAPLSALLAGLLGPTVVRVDGAHLRIARGGRLRSWPWTELREVGLRRGDLQLVRIDGGRVRLRASRLPDDERSRLRARIEAAVARTAGPLPTGGELLARAGRTLPDWRRSLARLVVDEGYRARGLSVEAAEAVLAARRAPAEERIGAAFALAASGEPRAHERIRLAASTCPDRRLRAALLEITEAEPSEATVERALPRGD